MTRNYEPHPVELCEGINPAKTYASCDQPGCFFSYGAYDPHVARLMASIHWLWGSGVSMPDHRKYLMEFH